MFTRLLGFALCFLSAVAIASEEPRPERISASHTEGNGLGYTRGYTSLDLFLSQPFYQKQLVPFLDLRGHIFNDVNFAANAGLGFRWLNDCRIVWGASFFYDYFETSRRPYNQLAAGLEAMGESWSVYLNGYLPIGHKETELYEFFYIDTSPNDFLVVGTEQFAMKGVDGEVGYRFCMKKFFDFYAGLGPYYYWGKSAATENAFPAAHRHFLGGRFTASASFWNYVAVGGVVTYDSLFKWGGQATIALSLPFDWNTGERRCKNYCLQERLYQPVGRNEIIVVDRIHRYSTNPDILNPEFEP